MIEERVRYQVSTTTYHWGVQGKNFLARLPYPSVGAFGEEIALQSDDVHSDFPGFSVVGEKIFPSLARSANIQSSRVVRILRTSI